MTGSQQVLHYVPEAEPMLCLLSQLMLTTALMSWGNDVRVGKKLARVWVINSKVNPRLSDSRLVLFLL